MRAIKCFGLRFTGLSVDSILDDTQYKQLVTVNSEFIVKANEADERLRDIINTSCSTFDGQIPFILARVLNPKSSFEKISGSDFIYQYAGYASRTSKRMLLIGATKSSNTLAVRRLSDKYGASVSGISPDMESYPFSEKFNAEINNVLTSFRPHAIFVGFGAVKQEYWIKDNEAKLIEVGVELAVGCGGSIDFVSGVARRAPRCLQVLCLEGVYRFFFEPKLFRFLRLINSARVFKYLFR